jgi:uncharacterized integral membrane protein (TIGR00698 family)
MQNMFNKVSFWLMIFSLILLNYIEFKYVHFLPGIALLIGIILAATHQDENLSKTTKVWATRTLSYAIIFLGFGFNLNNILKAGASGIGYTMFSIGATLILGLLLGKLLGNNGKISTLISAGTAICGGSAIAAISPIIKANAEQTAVAIGVIFLLNAVALILFPYIGHHLQLTQHQFGLLSALAIHDTSSVVGSCFSYGQQALIVGTTVKLVRALWIIPVSLIIALIYSRTKHEAAKRDKIKKPWFILWFILASLIATVFPTIQPLGLALKHWGESLFIVALFLIGYNVSFANLKAVGTKVLIQAVSLWIMVCITVIAALKLNWLN